MIFLNVDIPYVSLAERSFGVSSVLIVGVSTHNTIFVRQWLQMTTHLVCHRCVSLRQSAAGVCVSCYGNLQAMYFKVCKCSLSISFADSA